MAPHHVPRTQYACLQVDEVIESLMSKLPGESFDFNTRGFVALVLRAMAALINNRSRSLPNKWRKRAHFDCADSDGEKTGSTESSKQIQNQVKHTICFTKGSGVRC